MDLRFVSPSLRRLDEAATEVVVAGFFSDARPPQGLMGLMDWRLSGRLSRLLQRGWATGQLGEVLLTPGRPKLRFDKLLLFGLGARADFNERVYRGVIEKILSTLEGLRVRTAVVELPGRHVGAIDAERAVQILLECAGDRAAHDSWTLVDDADAQRLVAQLLAQERRRARRAAQQ